MDSKTTKGVLSTAASIAATTVLIRTVTNDLLPTKLQDYISSSVSAAFAHLSSRRTISIDEYDGPFPNQVYKAAEAYLATKVSPSTTRLRVTKRDDDDSDGLQVTIHRGEELVDLFQGIEFKWTLSSRDTPKRSVYHNRRSGWNSSCSSLSELQSFELTFHKKHKDVAIGSYLPFVLEKAKAMREEAKTLKLYTNDDGLWTAVNMNHPSTFETLVMDEELKREVMGEGLKRFVEEGVL